MVASMIASPPPSGGLAPHLLSTNNNNNNSIEQKQPPWKSQAVNRTNELLSCARTALKIGQHNHRQRQEQQLKEQQQGQQGSLLFQSRSNKDDTTFPEWLVDINPAQLSLYQRPPPPSSDHHHHHDQNGHTASSSDSTTSLLSDSQSLLSLLDNNLSQLHSLVRKRGHTNDPTQQINSLMSKFQEAAQEMKQVCELLRLAGTIVPIIDPYDTTTNKRKRSSGQRRKHYELVSTQLELLAKERMERLKVELETRSQVLRDQTNRRKLLATGAGGAAAATSVTANGKSTASGPPPRTTTNATRLSQPSRLPKSNPKSAPSQFQSPLFTATSGPASSNSGGVQRRSNAHHSNNNSSSSGYSGYAGYGGTTNNSTSSSAGYGGTTSRAGYGGVSTTSSSASSAPSFATGIRQRKQQQQQQSRIQIDQGGDNDDDKYNKDNDAFATATVQQQIQERRQNRAAQSRLASARLAEKSIAELGVMFTKMSTLISQQGEVLERIEDDVEAAGLDIDAGHDELVKVYGMTKGNRGLILKVFGILIFLIVFMKLY